MNRLTHLLAGSAMAFALLGYTAAPTFADDKPEREHKREHKQDGERGERGPRHGDHDHHKRIHKMLFQGIELTEEQQEQIREIHRETRAAHEEWREAHQDEIDAIRDEMKAAREAEDREAMKAAHEKMRELMKSAPGPHTAMDRIKNEVLTDDQIPQFEENLEKVKEQMKQRREKHRGDGKHKKGDGERKGRKHHGDEGDED